LLKKLMPQARKINRGPDMQDIDFDELDRAVSSTIGPKPKAEDTSDTSVAVNVSRPESSSPPPTPAARRSSGRFMDVVHPSSDMRSTSTERSEPRKPEAPVPSKPEAAPTDWPDPLDFHGFKMDDTDEAEAPAPTPVEANEASDESTKPLESPFLSDTKVEKRPLGAFSTAEAKELPTAPEEPETPLLEASGEELIPAETEKAEEPEAVEAPTEPEAPIEGEPTPPEVEEPIGPTSITQQYKEQPSTADQPSGAIFDTEAYHQPLAHPEKKRSGAMVILWIIALILLGAGVGAGVYFFVLPML
jgi:hypothetical protein